MRKLLKSIVFLFVPVISLLVPRTAYAVCPVCTVAVGAGLGLSRWLGVDDTISGLWIGGLLLSSSLWLISCLKNKFLRIPLIHNSWFIILAAYLLVLIPLILAGIVGHPFNKLWGVDKLLLGTAFGSLAFWLGLWADKKVRETRGRQLFKYQRIAFPILSLIIASVISWIIIRN